MKNKLSISLLILLMLCSMFLNAQTRNSDAESDIESILITSYVEGVFKEFSEEKIRLGFHKDFQFHAPMMTQNGRILKKIDLDSWIGMLQKMNFENIEYKLLNVTVTDNAAATTNEIYQNGKKIYTDYMLWQNIDGNWKIMGKVFAYHQKRM